MAVAEVPDYQKQAMGTFYGGGFGNINQTEWSDEEDNENSDEDDLEVEELR